MKPQEKYPKPLIAIHWITFLLLAFTFIRGNMLEDLEFTEANMNAFRMHAVPGVIILILTLIRMRIKRRNKDRLPEELDYYGPLHKVVVESVHKLLYILLILTPLFGFIMMYKTGALQYDLGGAFPEGVEFQETLETFHKVFAFSLLGLVALHFVGGLIYLSKNGIEFFKKMCILIK